MFCLHRYYTTHTAAHVLHLLTSVDLIERCSVPYKKVFLKDYYC